MKKDARSGVCKEMHVCLRTSIKQLRSDNIIVVSVNSCEPPKKAEQENINQYLLWEKSPVSSYDYEYFGQSRCFPKIVHMMST